VFFRDAENSLESVSALPRTEERVVGRLESGRLLAISLSGMGLEPSGSPKWTAASKIRERWQITTMNV